MNATRAIEEIRTTCAITGGGPAGMMLGFLLARAGVKVMVLEKHQDFLSAIGHLLPVCGHLATQPVEPVTTAPDRRRRFRVIEGGKS